MYYNNESGMWTVYHGGNVYFGTISAIQVQLFLAKAKKFTGRAIKWLFALYSILRHLDIVVEVTKK
jgi:hypothetical protein